MRQLASLTSCFLHNKLDTRGESWYSFYMHVSADSVNAKVLHRIDRGGSDRVWTFADFPSLPTMALAAALSRAAKKGILRRVRKGVYYVPRHTRFGETRPEPLKLAAAILKARGIAWTPSGPAAYNGLGLTTQVSPTATLAVNSGTRSLRLGLTTKLRLRPAARVRGLAPQERAVLDALRDLRCIPGTSPAQALKRILSIFESGRMPFERVARLARKEPPRVRALLGAVGSMLGRDPTVLSELRRSLNPTTTFRLGIADALPTARTWNIR
jgi:hypothetical protein